MKTLEILLTLALAVTFNVSPAAAQRNDTRKETAREIWPDIRAVEAMIRSGELLDIVKEYIPDFE